MATADASGCIRSTMWKRPLSKIVLALVLVLLNRLPDDTSMNNQWPSLALNWCPIIIGVWSFGGSSFWAAWAVATGMMFFLVKKNLVVRCFYCRPCVTLCVPGQYHAVWTRYFENKNRKNAKPYTIFSMLPIERIGAIQHQEKTWDLNSGSRPA